MNRDEQVGVELACDLAALLQHQEAVVAARERDAELAAFDKFVADRAGNLERDVLLMLPAIRGRGPRIVPAVTRIDYVRVWK